MTEMVIYDRVYWIPHCCQTNVGSKEPCGLNTDQINK